MSDIVKRAQGMAPIIDEWKKQHREEEGELDFTKKLAEYNKRREIEQRNEMSVKRKKGTANTTKRSPQRKTLN